MQEKIKEIISTFLKFVDNMLFFASLNGNFYQGFKKGGGSISEEIINRGKLKDFENFFKLDISFTEFKFSLLFEQATKNKQGNNNKIILLLNFFIFLQLLLISFMT